MNDDSGIIGHLCAKAGMLMEDAGANAIQIAGQTTQVRNAKLINLAHSAHLANALTNAALALDRRANN